MYVTWNVQFHENAPYFSQSECSLQGEKVQSIFEDSTPSLNLNTPSISVPSIPVPSLNPNILPDLSISSPRQIIEDSLSISSPKQITEDSPSISLRPENNQESTSSQSTPEDKESPDVHNEVNSSPLVTPNTEPRYPSRINKGIPKRQYDPDLNTKAKYPINNFISTHRLSESYAYTVNQLSTVSIPSNVQEALDDPD